MRNFWQGFGREVQGVIIDLVLRCVIEGARVGLDIFGKNFGKISMSNYIRFSGKTRASPGHPGFMSDNKGLHPLFEVLPFGQWCQA
jgi:hypothetical protein